MERSVFLPKSNKITAQLLETLKSAYKNLHIFNFVIYLNI